MDCLVVGGGVVGLSIAWVLSGEGCRVTVVDRQPLGREASWAGAGILPPAQRGSALHPIERMRAWSNELHPQWANQLEGETGIDTGYRRCGGIYVARTLGEAAALIAMAATWDEEAIACQRLAYADLIELEPGVASDDLKDSLRFACLLPEEAQLRNPRHLQALLAACQARGVKLEPNAEIVDWERAADRITGARTSDGIVHRADQFVIAGGAWSGLIAAGLVPGGVTPAGLARPIEVIPIRGQMILYRLPRPVFSRILNEGSRYVVPREDGHVLVGSTEEEVGFQKGITDEEMADLERVAVSLVPALANAKIEGRWSGLRPSSFDGFPYIGRLNPWSNVLVATGHFRSGLHLSPATAMVIASLLAERPPEIDIALFSPNR